MNSSQGEENSAFQPIKVWREALRLMEQYHHAPGKADIILERLPDRLDGLSRRRIQMLFLSAVRHALRIEKSLAFYMRKPPRPKLKAILHLACGEMMLREPEERAAVVDHAVEQTKALCSKGEAAMTNAVLRKIVANWDGKSEKPLPLHVSYSHPHWMVKRWIETHGEDVTRQWLELNQCPPEITVRLFGEARSELPEGFEETQWPGFVRVTGAQWKQVEALIRAGLAYIQDPSTRIPVALLRPQAGESVLDLCAAPGGKSYSIARAVGPDGKLVALDLPGRTTRLRENLARTRLDNYSILELDLLTLRDSCERLGVPSQYDAVLIDAPCSNTGVLRRRPDAKWRLKEKDISHMSEIQLKLLTEAAKFVKPGGRLVYSTCSVEPEENTGVAEKFLAAHKDTFQLEAEKLYYPHEAQHDGGGAFRFVSKIT